MEQRGAPGPGLVLLLLVLVPVPVPAQVRHPLPVLLMMPVSSGPGRGGSLTWSLAPAVHMALQDLKTQPGPLGNYEIQLQLLDSQCDPAEALRALFDAVWAGPRYLLLLGGACPSVTALIGRALPALHLLQVSFASPSPSVLSNRKLYGGVFSVAPSQRSLHQALLKLLQRFRWSRVALITEEGGQGAEMKKDLVKQILKVPDDVQLVSAQSLSSDVCSSLKTLKDKDVRIIIGQFEDDSVPEVFCCAYRLNMFGSGYQWLLVGGGSAVWSSSSCSADSLLTAAEGSFRLQIKTFSSSNMTGVSGRTPQDYRDSYHRQLSQQGSKVSPLHGFAYDAVWVAASALSAAMETAKHREKYSSQRPHSVSQEEVHTLLLDKLRHTQLQGVTGPVSFRNGERMGSIELIQVQGGMDVSVGDFSTSTQQLRLFNQLLKFKGPGPARDRTLVLEQRLQVGLLLYATMSSAAAVTIFITLSVLFLTAINHKHRLLRSRSGSQDVLLLIGVLLSSSSVLVSGLDGASLSHHTLEVLCSVRLWTLSVGHMLGLAVLLIRTWRLHSLHSTKQTQPACCGVLLLILLLDVFVLTSWQILDPLRRVVLQHSSQSDPADQDVVVHLYSELCSSSDMDLWLTAVYGYKAPLLGLACFVAWSIRALQVDPPAVSSKRLSVSVFAVTVFSVSGASGSLLTSHNPPLHFCVTSVLILGCNVFTLSCLFGPQLLHGGELQGEATDGEEEDKKKKKKTKKKKLSRLNQQLRSRTAQLDVEIETISMQLYDTCEQLHRTTRPNNGEVRAVTWAHAAQICPDHRHSSGDAINSPELVRRRLSVQLPILHLSYLPAVGGVSASSSSLFGSQDVFIYHDDNFLFTTRQPAPRYC
ncbi:gamma-aminobutyric acid type B receptor subunit 2-like isoform X2 [Centropristis striata]|uniref:gamma-aminobutyric acid type B receptor subunit 2-like isoform X2 n=1 Tax=Centropristis striata TaxID=184440 RepID=UPI0027E00296|nr:gamma-aminobutyric acid type B receptor subunit 2-like isoform X2 [Centropristis striata]